MRLSCMAQFHDVLTAQPAGILGTKQRPAWHCKGLSICRSTEPSGPEFVASRRFPKPPFYRRA